MRGDTQAHADAVPFRVWPPVALGVPLTLGLVCSQAVGEPFRWPPGRHWVALGLIVLFGGWNGACLVMFHRHRTGLLPGQSTRRLLTSGPFRLSRNPLYLGLAVLYVGLAVAAASTWALAFLPVGLLTLRRGAIDPEERYLATRFGREYEDYRRRVPRWL